MGSYRFILSGGGTGGHIYPAIAIADELKKRFKDADILFVGAKDKMEMEKVPMAGYTIKGLWISGLQRKLTIKNLLFPIKLISSLVSARKIIKEFQPDIAIGTGGFASGPLLKMAASAGIPCVLQEQNSFPGITNRLLAKKAKKICVAYDGMERFFPTEKIVKTGNPVRADLIDLKTDKKEALAFFGFDDTLETVLVLGGSLGARRMNQLIEDKLDFLKAQGTQVLWQCGRLYYDDYKKHNTGTVCVRPYINRMDHAYTVADVIISRAGAGSVSELSLVGKPTLFIPSPNVTEDHQTKNAKALVLRSAAVMIKEKDLEEHFEDTFSELMGSPDKRNALQVNFKKMAMPKATSHIVNEIEKLM
ncbi:MAG: undecaprenyldiphospho-muramoylpentapeptide beta-N-acetylglucosaminyltransferase [Bacteroidota bacterium]